MSRAITVSIATAALAVGFLWGVASERFEWFPHALAKAALHWIDPGGGALQLGYNDSAGRAKLDCRALADNTLALLLFGQSNAANSGETRYPARPGGVYNFNILDQHCYEAVDPLLGTSGTGGSIWTRLAARIVDQGFAPRVLLVPIAVSGSTIAQWAPPGELSERAPAAIDQLHRLGIPIAAALWQQGESDGATDSTTYAEHFVRVAEGLRAAGFAGRVILSHSTRCGGPPSETVRAANVTIVRELRGAEMGPDLDQLAGPEFRYDGCHLNERGQQVASVKWLEALFRGTLSSSIQ